MHILIISATPHSLEYSNTNKLIAAFEQGILESESEAEILYLSHKKEWDKIIQKFAEAKHIVFAIPVYVGIVPSLFKEFLELLYKNKSSIENKNISYILQSGYPESTQRSCCEKYLESFTTLINCSFGGILSHGIDYGFIDNVSFEQTLRFYVEFGKEYIAHNASFSFEKAILFTGVDNLTEQQARNFIRYFNFFCKHAAQEINTYSRLYDTPLED